MAFFPLFPMLVNITNRILNLKIHTTAILLTNLFFVLNSLLIYKLTLKRYGKTIATNSALFFIFNPASIIFSSFYTESFFMFLFLMGFYAIEYDRAFIASLFFGLSSLTRSNGILFSIFLLPVIIPNTFTSKLLSLLKTILLCIISIIPFLGFQYYSYSSIPGNKDFLFPYSMIQSKYWNQGLFKFYTLINIGNFIIGFPFVMLAIYLVFKYLSSPIDYRLIIYDRQKRNLFCLVTLLAIQIFMVIFFIHWNMFFRFISYNPFIYWSLAILYDNLKKSKKFLFFLLYYFNFGILYAVMYGCY
ncbi:GPI mannosyltransferase 2, partial [Astathelohania contejeani]